MIYESEVCDIESFMKSQVFVFDNFEGSAFQHVLSAAKENKAVLVNIFNSFIYAIYYYYNNNTITTQFLVLIE